MKLCIDCKFYRLSKRTLVATDDCNRKRKIRKSPVSGIELYSEALNAHEERRSWFGCGSKGKYFSKFNS
jgi:hypothetical protein